MNSGLNAARKTLMVATVVAAAAVLSSCKDKPQEKPVINGSPMSPTINFRFAVFMLPTPEKDPQVALAAAIGKYSPNLRHIADIPEKPIEMVVKMQLLKNVAKEYPPPTAEELKYSGFGLSKGQGGHCSGQNKFSYWSSPIPKKESGRRCVPQIQSWSKLPAIQKG